MQQYTCTRCNTKKDSSEFATHKASGGILKRRSNCKDCYNLYYRKYLKNDKHRDLVVNKQKSLRENLKKIKIDVGCIVCGYNKCSDALEFHHLDRNSKKENISRLVAYGNEESVNQEISKCVVLCANCHREFECGLIQLPN